MTSHNGWIGVDLDGTLAYYDEWRGASHVGEPIMPMVERVKGWIAEGKSVRIVTARVSSTPTSHKRQRDAAYAMIAIQDWCFEHLGTILPVVCTKDFDMIELYDDRCRQVEKNTGQILY
jgi:hypothetical protein